MFADVSEVLAASIVIALMIEAAGTSKMLVNFYQITRRYNPENSHFHTRRRKNLKSYYCFNFTAVYSVHFMLGPAAHIA
jgi:hypothetical protein